MRVRAYLRGKVTDAVVRRVVRGVKTVDRFTDPANLARVIDGRSSWILLELAETELAAINQSIDSRVMRARKVTPEILQQIKATLDEGVRMKVVEERFKVTRQTIYNHLKKAKP